MPAPPSSLLPPPPHCLKSTPHVGSTLPSLSPCPSPVALSGNTCLTGITIQLRFIFCCLTICCYCLSTFLSFSLSLSLWFAALVDLFSVSLSFFQLGVEKFPEKRFCGKPRNDRRIQPAMFDDNLRGICSVGARDGDEDADGDGAG